MRRVRSQFLQSVVGRLSFAVRNREVANGAAVASSSRGIGASFVGALVAALCVLVVVVPSAGAVPFGITGYFGNPDTASSGAGGLFGTVGANTAPQGVAVNDDSGDVYVVDGGNDRVQMFNSLGGFEWAIGMDVVEPGGVGAAPAINAEYSITLNAGVNAGNFKLSFSTQSVSTQTTDNIPFNATVAQVQAALENLAAVEPGDVEVALALGGDVGGGTAPGGPWSLEFENGLADTHVALARVNGAPNLNIAGNNGAAVVREVLGAAAVEKCEVAEDCKAGHPLPGAFGQGGAFSSPTGIAVNQTTGDFYVTNSVMRRIDQYEADGTFVRAWGADVVASGSGQADEEQVLIVNATGGQYRLEFAGQETADIDWNDSAGDVESALNALSTINTGGGSVDVSAGPTYPGNARSYLVEFNGGPLADINQPTLVRKAGTAPLTGGTKSVSVIPLNEGATGFEICDSAADCKAGVAAPPNSVNGWNGTVSLTSSIAGLAVAPAGAPNTGNVLVGSAAGVKEFSANGEFVRSFGYDSTTAGPDNGGSTDEVQTVTVRATSGTFMLRLGGAANNTVALPVAATAAQVEEALNATASIGDSAGWVTVTGGPGDATGSNPYVVTFHGTLQGKNLNAMVATGTGLAGGSPSSSVTVADGTGGATNGAPGFEVCKAASLEICVPEPSGIGAAGSGVGQFGSNTLPSRVAVDTSGSVYTVESASPNFRVQKFTAVGASLSPALHCPPVGSESLCGTGATDSPTDVAVDTNGDLSAFNDRVLVVKAYPAGTGAPAATVAERRVLELDTLGLLVETHLANSALNSVNGLAVTAGGQPGYLTSGTPKAGFYEIGVAVPPTATIAATTDVTATCATFNGSVNPNGGGSLTTSYRFEYSANGGDDWSQVPVSPVAVGNGDDPVVVQQTACSLEPNIDYQVRLVAIKGGESTLSTGNAGDFTTDPASPTVETFSAYWDTSTGELVLRGSVNPNNTQTSYWFEYGTEPCSTSSCTSVPIGEDASAGAGGQQVSVSRRVAGLDPGATYRFRIVADNGVGGPVEGDDRQFTTPTDEECANEEMRQANASTALADCRAIEWVTNGDSWGMGTFSILGTVPGGERVLFKAPAFNDPDSSPGGLNPYIAVREDDGWDVRSALPPAARAGAGGLSPAFTASSDLTEVLWPGTSFQQEFTGEVHWSIEGIDGTSTAAGPPLVPLVRAGPDKNLISWFALDAATDFSSFIFTRSFRTIGVPGGDTYLPDEPLVINNSGGIMSNLYEIVRAGGPDAELRLVNRVSDPAPGVLGAQIGGGCGATGHGVSGDGSVVWFSARPSAPGGGSLCVSAGNPVRLFKRVGGVQTVGVSEPTCDRVPALPVVPACGTTAPSGAAIAGGDDLYRGSSDDGSIVFFTSPRQLTDSDTDATSDLYAYDEDPPAGQPELVQVSAGEAVVGDHPTVGFGAEAMSVVDAAGDGSRVYFTAHGRLVPEAVKDKVNLYVWERSDTEPDGRIELVAVLDTGNGAFVSGPQGGDGRFLVFTTATKALAEDGDSTSDVYRYDDETEELVCVSCIGDGAFNVAISTEGPVSDDGSTIAFTTDEVLLAGTDVDDGEVLYLWRDGALGLISQGTGGFQSPTSSLLTPDGQSLFFMTSAALYAGDTNNARDVYVARIGGGFPPPVPKAVCADGDQCQGTGGDAPAASTPDSSTSTDNAKAQVRKTLAVSRLSKKARRKASRTGRVPVKVRASSTGRVSLTVKAKVGKKVRRVGRASKRAVKGRAITVNVRLSSAAKKRLRAGKKLRLTVEVRQSGARTRTRSILLPGVKP